MSGALPGRMTDNSRAAARSLFPYQRAAIDAWFGNDCRGIMAMATGTGKTFTALSAVQELESAGGELSFVIVAVPFTHLVDQWTGELTGMGYEAVSGYGSAERWTAELNRLSRKNRALSRTTFVVVTYAGLASGRLDSEMTEHGAAALLIADECHYLGAAHTRNVMKLPIRYRLGLSATPARYFDGDGTSLLMEYFSGVVFSYDLEEAIENGRLTPYRYYPEAVELTASEFAEYRELTARIGRAFALADQGGDEEAAHLLLLKRARLMNNAERKLDWLREKLAGETAESLRFTLVYVGDQLFDQVLELIGVQLGIPCHAFTAEQTTAERARLLKQFAAEEISILVAMKCLDEGVDVPPTRRAYFLASSGNRREFVQRRGRILRLFPEKDHAVIYDAVSVPPHSLGAITLTPAEISLLSAQFGRIQEFSAGAMNAIESDRALMQLRLAADLPLETPSEGAAT